VKRRGRRSPRSQARSGWRHNSCARGSARPSPPAITKLANASSRRVMPLSRARALCALLTAAHPARSTVEQPEDEGQHDAYHQRRHDREVKAETAPLDDNVPRQPSEPELSQSRPQQADGNEHQPNRDEPRSHLDTLPRRPQRIGRRARRLMIVRRSGLCPFGAADPVQRDRAAIHRLS